MKVKRFTTLLVSGVLAASMLVGCGGINKNETVATLDGQEIKLGVANFAARLQQAEADDFYRAYFGDDVWHPICITMEQPWKITRRTVSSR
jgi:foldase protein PrsA